MKFLRELIASMTESLKFECEIELDLLCEQFEILSREQESLERRIRIEIRVCEAAQSRYDNLGSEV